MFVRVVVKGYRKGLKLRRTDADSKVKGRALIAMRR